MQVVSTIRATKINKIGVGQGRNSEVFLARDPQLNGEIALKEIPLKSFVDPSDYFSEAQNLYKNKHPNIVPIMYACQDADKIRIVMPYFRNGSVQDSLSRGPLTVRQLIVWSHHFLLGLHHVHSNGYIHYDVKPTNLLIHDDGSVMLADFGQMRPTNVFGVADNPMMYSLHFPPEAFIYTKSTKQADIYQAGLTIYRMCNGETIFNAQRPQTSNELRTKVLNGSFPNRNKFLPHIPDRLKRVIRKALRVNASDRYQTALELADALGQVETNLDWKYSDTPGGAVWVTRNYSHEYNIEIRANTNAWYVDGKTIRLNDGLIRAKTAWCGGPFSTKTKAFNFVKEIFKELGEVS